MAPRGSSRDAESISDSASPCRAAAGKGRRSKAKGVKTPPADEDGDAADIAEDADRCLAIELAALLRVRHPGGLAVGALTGSDVRHALREPMRAAGLRSFKAKWLTRFPVELVFDGKTVKAAPVASKGVEEAAAAFAAEDAALQKAAELPPPKSCMSQRKPETSGIQTSKARNIEFADFVDVLVFKLGHEPGLVARKGQHVKRPMAAGDEVSQLYGSRNACLRNNKFAKEAWLDPAVLPPVDDSEGDPSDKAVTVEDIVVEPLDDVDSNDDVSGDETEWTAV